MDLSTLSIEELKKLRDTYREDLTTLKSDLRTVQIYMNDPSNTTLDEIKDIFEVRYPSKNEEEEEEEDEDCDENSVALDLLRSLTKIKSIEFTCTPITDSIHELYLYNCKGRFDKLSFELDYESNLPPDADEESVTDETISKLIIKISRPNIQAKLQNALDFYQQYPNNISYTVTFLRKLNDLIEARHMVLKKIYEFEKNINVSISKNTDQHSIIFCSEYDKAEFLNIKWSFKWELRTGFARDYFIAKIIRADEQLLSELKPLVEKLCTEKFSSESLPIDKINLLHVILVAIKDADTRNIGRIIS